MKTVSPWRHFPLKLKWCFLLLPLIPGPGIKVNEFLEYQICFFLLFQQTFTNSSSHPLCILAGQKKLLRYCRVGLGWCQGIFLSSSIHHPLPDSCFFSKFKHLPAYSLCANDLDCWFTKKKRHHQEREMMPSRESIHGLSSPTCSTQYR